MTERSQPAGTSWGVTCTEFGFRRLLWLPGGLGRRESQTPWGGSCRGGVRAAAGGRGPDPWDWRWAALGLKEGPAQDDPPRSG